MFRTRLLTAIVALPLVVTLIRIGGLAFFALVALILTAAVVEFCRLMEKDHFHPAIPWAVFSLWVLLLDAQFPAWNLLGPGLSFALLGSIAWQMFHRREKPTADWALTVAGAFYLGWCGSHILRLRSLPEGLWWVLTVLPAVWFADSGAYLVGRKWGRHKMAPALSPGKTWEGYAGGVVLGTILTTGLAALWGLAAGPQGPTAIRGFGIGLIVALLSPLGDLAISMIKRQVGVKDSGTLFPGHGGALDRIDSLLWAAVLGYYFILWTH
ncbi:MAG: phosphatidate cytidylyltransferase [Anaerolineae bacterium]|nr:phosphatidate cytidylyltransferase [Anaerolineae bacterium]MCX8067922.1 phosphatidate cytidylyltransferase [Anaerolineae bacterium]MDW7992373.1 phosphatidate cytidylyltransferase [Anaerolineae bacterium]